MSSPSWCHRLPLAASWWSTLSSRWEVQESPHTAAPLRARVVPPLVPLSADPKEASAATVSSGLDPQIHDPFREPLESRNWAVSQSQQTASQKSGRKLKVCWRLLVHAVR